MSQAGELIGSIVSVLTKKKLRYQGTLVNLDKAKKELHLEQIEQFGTEGRIGGAGEIAARTDIIEFAIFAIDLVENFEILKRPQAKEDPAIISTRPAKTPVAQEQKVQEPVKVVKEAVKEPAKEVGYGEARPQPKFQPREEETKKSMDL